MIELAVNRDGAWQAVPLVVRSGAGRDTQVELLLATPLPRNTLILGEACRFTWNGLEMPMHVAALTLGGYDGSISAVTLAGLSLARLLADVPYAPQEARP